MNRTAKLTGRERDLATRFGRLTACVFAQTPAAGYVPPSGKTYYPSTQPPAARARSIFAYDAAGRMLSDQTYWDTWNSASSSYAVEAVLDNECQYETGVGNPPSALARGLKTSSTFYKNSSHNSPSWTLDHTESYSYDPQLDYLTGANYGDGLPNATPTWTYDAAGNRYNGTNNNPACAFDNLNRPTELLGHTCTSDILGNRLTCGSQSYGWDALNRMTSYGTANSYVYRADGMRVSKLVGSTATTYHYDGQMGMEDVDVTAGVSTITDYGLGARGVEYISSTKSGTTTVGFPIYDAHGNMTACLFRSGLNYYSLANQRHYDAWGQIRNGAISGDPKGRYCASLGHKQDDESGLLYMRARYYEPSSGRFLSEDPSRVRPNWFVYGGNNPLLNTDPDGKSLDPFYTDAWLVGSTLCLLAVAIVGQANVSQIGFNIAISAASLAVVAFGFALSGVSASAGESPFVSNVGPYAISTLFVKLITTTIAGAQKADDLGGLAFPAVMALTTYNLALIGALYANQQEDQANG